MNTLIISAALLWTIFNGPTETVLQYGSEIECQEAIDKRQIPFLGVPYERLSCLQRPDHEPIERCSDGDVAYLAHGETCKRCVDKKTGQLLTSVLCEAHGYKPADLSQSDGIDYRRTCARDNTCIMVKP
jgi:hypothetical protein